MDLSECLPCACLGQSLESHQDIIWFSWVSSHLQTPFSFWKNADGSLFPCNAKDGLQTMWMFRAIPVTSAGRVWGTRLLFASLQKQHCTAMHTKHLQAVPSSDCSQNCWWKTEIPLQLSGSVLCCAQVTQKCPCWCRAAVPAWLLPWLSAFSPPQLSVGENLGILWPFTHISVMPCCWKKYFSSSGGHIARHVGSV